MFQYLTNQNFTHKLYLWLCSWTDPAATRYRGIYRLWPLWPPESHPKLKLPRIVISISIFIRWFMDNSDSIWHMIDTYAKVLSSDWDLSLSEHFNQISNIYIFSCQNTYLSSLNDLINVFSYVVLFNSDESIKIVLQRLTVMWISSIEVESEPCVCNSIRITSTCVRNSRRERGKFLILWLLMWFKTYVYSIWKSPHHPPVPCTRG